MEHRDNAEALSISSASERRKDDMQEVFDLLCVDLLNRRIPNGTYGGVGGRGLIAPSYPIETPDCEVVCFSNEQGIHLNKADVKVRVGVKETEDPIPVCYCFGWTRKKILDQIK